MSTIRRRINPFIFPLAIVVVALVVACGRYILIFVIGFVLNAGEVYPPPHAIVESTSPDRQNKVLIIEHPPQNGMASPWQYELTVQDASGRVLPGTPYQFGNDSASIGESNFKITWANRGATVTWGNQNEAGLTLNAATQSWQFDPHHLFAAAINVDASRFTTPLPSTGLCLEDVNHEIYGGLYSQMIFGESFQEPANASGVSGMWQPIHTGDAELCTDVIHARALYGTQGQQLTFVRGSGEVGLANRGLQHGGLTFELGQPYEGAIYVLANQAMPLIVSIDSDDGTASYARATLAVSASDRWQLCHFTLTPQFASGEPHASGAFSVRLATPGSITLGYVFLQPGEKTRYHHLPVRRDVAEAMLGLQIGFVRYGGSMINEPTYRWKQMIGPREARRPYKGHWYPQSTNGFGIIDFLNFAAEAGVTAVPDLSIDESPQDLLDFIEYANGPADSEWGNRRVRDGHPQPYHLTHIELGNEEKVNANYAAKFAKLADAIWAKDPQMILIVGDFAYRDHIADPLHITGADSGIDSLSPHQQILSLAKQHNAEVWFDVHLWTESLPPSPSAVAVTSYIDAIDKLADGARHRVVVFELNANKHDLMRALSNADAMIDLFRDGRVPMIAPANALQVDGHNDNGWDQGLVFLNGSQTWLQPPAYALRMFQFEPGSAGLATDVQTSDPALKAIAVRSADKAAVDLIVLNGSQRPWTGHITLAGFVPTTGIVTSQQLVGPPDATNTAADPQRIVPVSSDHRAYINDGVMLEDFPGRSLTRLRLK